MCRIMDRLQWNMSLVLFDGNHKLWLQSSSDLQPFQNAKRISFCASLLQLSFVFTFKMQCMDSYTFYINEIYM